MALSEKNCHFSLTPSFSLCGVEAGHLSVSPTALLSLSYHHRDRKRPLARPRHWVWAESVLVSLCVYVHARVLESVCVENGICCMPQTWGKTTFWTRFSICVCLWQCLYVKGRKIRGRPYVCVFVCDWGTRGVVDCMLLKSWDGMFPGTLSETANSASLGKKTSNKLHPDSPSLHQLQTSNKTSSVHQLLSATPFKQVISYCKFYFFA